MCLNIVDYVSLLQRTGKTIWQMKVPKKDGERVDEFIMKGKATTVSNFG